MIDIRHNVDIINNVDDVIEISKNQIAVKIKNPTINVEKNNPFMVSLYSLNKYKVTHNETLVFIPMVEQYYHNFYEIFSRLIMLKQAGQEFRVVLVRDDKIEDGIFCSLIKDHQKANRNSTHLKDFFEHAQIDFICVNSKDVKKIKAKYTFAFFYLDKKLPVSTKPRNNIFIYKNKAYRLHRFLDKMNKQVFIENIEIMRNFLPKYEKKDTNKIFISRSNAPDRKYQQEQDLEAMVLDLGYKIVHLEKMHFLDQILLLQLSSHILCPYGSALVNATICTNSKVLSINYTPGYYVGTYELAFEKYNIDYTTIEIKPEDPILSIMDMILSWENKDSTFKNIKL